MKTMTSFFLTLLSVLVLLVKPTFAAAPNWDLVGAHQVTFTCVTGCSGDWVHTMDVTSMNMLNGDFSGTGFYNADNSYTWSLFDSKLDGSSIAFKVNYTGTAAGSQVYSTGTIDASGLAHGTFTSNYSIEGTWAMNIDPAKIVVAKPTDKDQCKKDGWKTFTSPAFKNQGACVSYVQSNEHAGKRD